MPFAATFGAFGDFVALVQILSEVVQALRDVGGSSSQYLGFMHDISDFHTLLEDVSELRPCDIPSHIHEHLRNCVLRAAETARAFQGRITPYHASLRLGGTGRQLSDAYRKVKWNFLMRSKVKEFIVQMSRSRIAILGHLMTANISLSARRLYQGARSETPQIATPHRVLRRTMALSLQHTNISRDPRRFYVEEFPIRFTDAMGMKLTVPFRIFAAYDRFTRYIKRHFCDSPGRALIERGMFALTNESGHTIRKSVWKILPGSKVDMIVVIPHFGARDRCPKCTGRISAPSGTCVSWGTAIFEVDNEQWEANTRPDVPRQAENNIIRPGPSFQNIGHAMPKKTEMTLTTVELARHFKRIALIKIHPRRERKPLEHSLERRPGFVSTIIFHNHLVARYGLRPQWNYTMVANVSGEPVWEARLDVPPISVNEAGTTHYVGRGRNKTHARNAAAHTYLSRNQIVLPPPLVDTYPHF